mmetsp:Transcript_75076/g.208774  ORF Transcript_75076/g.208774 Transcript_75076/m.208774 type:complete len:153 (+) Transcript_75076:61-519(+)
MAGLASASAAPRFGESAVRRSSAAEAKVKHNIQERRVHSADSIRPRSIAARRPIRAVPGGACREHGQRRRRGPRTLVPASEESVAPDVAFNVLMNSAAKNSSLAVAVRWFETASQARVLQDLYTYDIVISAAARERNNAAAEFWFKRLQEER